jgi:glycosyltransferase involved in cell wall biosynthesis
MTTRRLLDLSRLLYRANRPTPTGIDRVELAYARHLIATSDADRLGFCATTFRHRLGPLGFGRATRLIGALERRWGGDESADLVRELSSVSRALLVEAFLGGEASLYPRERASGRDVVYLLVSHHHLNRPALFERLRTRLGAKIVCLVHDLIPIQFPEYGRPGQEEVHRRRMQTVADLADGIIFNSNCTREAFENLITSRGRADAGPLGVVAPLGIDDHAVAPVTPIRDAPPYFVCIATIEPKKNHLLLLNLWRRLAEELGAAAPRLVLVGQRGWENENVVDMIERCAPLQGLLDERCEMGDQAVRELLSGARALLAPSFTEGYGLPVAEALGAGTPVICSDLAAFREVGGEVPDYLDPLDGPGWRNAILDYAAPHSPGRASQLARLAGWTLPTWSSHFERVQPMLDGRLWPSASRATLRDRPAPDTARPASAS